MLKDLLNPELTKNVRNPSACKALRRRLHRELRTDIDSVTKTIDAAYNVGAVINYVKPNKKMIKKMDPLFNKIDKIFSAFNPSLKSNITYMESITSKPTGDLVYSNPQLYSVIENNRTYVGLGKFYVAKNTQHGRSRIVIHMSTSLSMWTHHPIEQFFHRADENTFKSFFACMEEVDTYLSCVFPKDIPDNTDIVVPCSQGVFLGVKQAITKATTHSELLHMNNHPQIIFTTFVSNNLLFHRQLDPVQHALKIGKTCLPEINAELNTYLLSLDNMISPNNILKFRLSLAKSFGFQMDLNDHVDMIDKIDKTLMHIA